MAKTHTRKEVPARSKADRKITNESRQRWKEHYEEVLNMDGPAKAIEQIQSEELDLTTDPPSISEIAKV